MLLIELIAFLLMMVAILILLEQSPFELARVITSFVKVKKPNMKKRILAVQKPKKVRGIQKIFLESRQVLKATNQTEKYFSLTILSLGLFVIGLIVASGLNNPFLIPVLAIGFALIPNLFVLYSSSKYRKQLNVELESALSTITTSYRRSENFLSSVRENLVYLNAPVHDVFMRFLNRVESIDPDVIAALESMKAEIDNSVFQEWIEAVILCQNDRSLISTLLPIVKKFSKIRTVTDETELAMYKQNKTYLTMLGLLYGIIILICVGNADWSHYLLDLPLGKIILACVVSATLITAVRVIQLTRPIEYKR